MRQRPGKWVETSLPALLASRMAVGDAGMGTLHAPSSAPRLALSHRGAMGNSRGTRGTSPAFPALRCPGQSPSGLWVHALKPLRSHPIRANPCPPGKPSPAAWGPPGHGAYEAGEVQKPPDRAPPGSHSAVPEAEDTGGWREAGPAGRGGGSAEPMGSWGRWRGGSKSPPGGQGRASAREEEERRGGLPPRAAPRSGAGARGWMPAGAGAGPGLPGRALPWQASRAVPCPGGARHAQTHGEIPKLQHRGAPG